MIIDNGGFGVPFGEKLKAGAYRRMKSPANRVTIPSGRREVTITTALGTHCLPVHTGG